MLLGFLLNQIAILDEIADERINLLEGKRSRWTVLQVMPNEAILVDSHLQSQGTSFLDRRRAELLGQSEHALDAADSDLTLATMEGMTKAADMRAGLLGSPQQLMDAQGSSWGTILFLDAMEATFLADMLAHELTGFGVQDSNEDTVPLHFDGATWQLTPSRSASAARSPKCPQRSSGANFA